MRLRKTDKEVTTRVCYIADVYEIALFHCWTTRNGEPKAIVEYVHGDIFLIDPERIRFSDTQDLVCDEYGGSVYWAMHDHKKGKKE